MAVLFNRLMVKAEEKPLVRPSDLPLYDEPAKAKYVLLAREPGALEQNIKIARETASSVRDQVHEVEDKISHIIETGKAHTQGAYNQLLEEDNVLGRVGVIAGMGTIGFMVGFVRGRLLKRILYTSVGAGSGSAICYPDDTQQITTSFYSEARKKAMIAYNFVNGVEYQEQGGAESRLIASSIVRITRLIGKYLTALREKIRSTNSGTTETSVVGEVVNNKLQQHQVIHLVDDGSRKVVAGDPGQGKEEDKDLYTTRS